MSTYQEREPEGVPARWLRGELSSEEAIMLAFMSDRLDWHIWAGTLLAVRTRKPIDLIKMMTSVL